MATNTEKIVVQVVVQGQKQLDGLEGGVGKTTKSVGRLQKELTKLAARTFAATAAFNLITTSVSNAIRSFRDFEFQMAKVKAITNSSERDFKKIKSNCTKFRTFYILYCTTSCRITD